jgi:hypothetical protein
MNIDSKLRESARIHFEKKAQETIKSLLRCWPHMIGTYLRAINNLVEAGRKMGVTEAELFTAEEISAISAALGPLAELEMWDDIRDYLTPQLIAKKLEQELLALSAPKTA